MKTAASLIAILVACAGANADLLSGTVTADNHYALYTATGNAFTSLGGNEIGAAGSPGTYNWSLAESYSFPAAQYLYIATWSDASTAQGVLADFSLGALGELKSGDPRWQVFDTGVPRTDGDPHPGAPEIAALVAAADAGNDWDTIFAGGANGSQPWGAIAGIDTDAHWMWNTVAGDADPTIGARLNADMLIFRAAIPSPPAAGIAGLGLLLFLARRRQPRGARPV